MKTAAVILGTAILYAVTAHLSLYLQYGDSAASPVWPPAGIAASAVCLFGPAAAVGAALGAFVANAIDSVWWVALGICVGNGTEAYICGLAARRWSFARVEHVGTMLTIFSGACLLSAGNGALWMNARLASYAGTASALTWALGDLVGVLSCLPIIVGLTRRQYL